MTEEVTKPEKVSRIRVNITSPNGNQNLIFRGRGKMDDHGDYLDIKIEDEIHNTTVYVNIKLPER